jgi:pyroglutamyl-peptidase
MKRPATKKKAVTRTVLVTGFEPFGGGATNPSQEIARALAGREIAGRRVAGAVLPCVFGDANHALRRLLREHRPELVICLGLAAGRSGITPERVAINVDDARMPDNAGCQPVDQPIVAGGPAAYWSTLPIKAIVAALRTRGIEASVSQTAGTFVCNHVFYGLMHALRRRPGVRGGFVHLPEEAGRGGADASGLSREAMIAAIAEAIAVALCTRRDRRITGGANQ